MSDPVERVKVNTKQESTENRQKRISDANITDKSGALLEFKQTLWQGVDRKNGKEVHVAGMDAELSKTIGKTKETVQMKSSENGSFFTQNGKTVRASRLLACILSGKMHEMFYDTYLSQSEAETLERVRDTIGKTLKEHKGTQALSKTEENAILEQFKPKQKEALRKA